MPFSSRLVACLLLMFVATAYSVADPACQVPGRSGGGAQNAGALERLAQRAKANGERSARSKLIVDMPLDANLDEVSRTLSWVLAIPTEPYDAVLSGPEFIYTCYFFKVERTLSISQQLQLPSCGWKAPSRLPISLGADKIAIPFIGGVATISGVEVTQISNYPLPKFEREARILLAGDRCPDGIFQLPYALNGVFKVGRDGEVSSLVPEQSQYTFVREVLGLRSLSSILKRLQTKGTSLHSVR